ncbi:hypothetical protein CRG98_031291, partial [Punica granatum]
AMEANKADWNTLFEPYAFFEAYKNYLQIDISAANADDLRSWKGWVESRLRQLTLKIERHTFNMLQCHPHPGEFTDKSRPFHCSYFMGLQRKQGVPVNEGEQFDIRLTVEEFKKAVNMYTVWKPGMEICVTHVRRKNIPNYVFPGGVRPPRPKNTWDMRRAAELRLERSPESKAILNGSAEDGKKRKREEDADPNSGNPKHAAVQLSSSVEAAEVSLTTASTASSSYTKGYDLHDSGIGESGTKKNEYEGSASSKEAENLAIEKVASVPYVGAQASVEELDELEDELVCKDQSKEIPKVAIASSFVSPNAGVTSAGSGNGSSPSTDLHAGSVLDELEPAELTALTPITNPQAPPVQGKPLIRLSLTSVAKATGKSA